MDKGMKYSLWILGNKSEVKELFKEVLAIIQEEDGSLSFERALPGTNFKIVDSYIDYEDDCIDFTTIGQQANELGGYLFDHVFGITVVLRHYFYDENGEPDYEDFYWGQDEHIDEFYGESEPEE